MTELEPNSKLTILDSNTIFKETPNRSPNNIHKYSLTRYHTMALELCMSILLFISEEKVSFSMYRSSREAEVPIFCPVYQKG